MQTSIVWSDGRHTSTDRIDDLLANCSSEASNILTTHDRKYLPHILKELQETLLTADLSRINKAVSESFAFGVQELLYSAGISPTTVTAIGRHGQTARHKSNAPSPHSQQMGPRKPSPP